LSKRAIWYLLPSKSPFQYFLIFMAFLPGVVSVAGWF
jgi:hypothetical protein